MATDITLDAEDGSFVVVESRVLKVTASDFILDAPARRAQSERGVRGFRRALVHNHQDGLTINFNRDYPGGVTINDVVALNNRQSGIRLTDVVEIGAYRDSRVDPGADVAPVGAMVLRGEIRIEREPEIRASALNDRTGTSLCSQGEVPVSDTVSLQELITNFQSELAQLRERITHLERRSI